MQARIDVSTGPLNTGDRISEYRIQETEFRKGVLLTPAFCLLSSPFYWILPQALVFQLSIASSPKIQGGSGINNNSESALT